MIWIPSPFGSDQTYLVTAIWRDETHGSTSYEIVGGPKAFLRVWDGGPIEWAWIVHEDAQLVLDTPIPVGS